MMKISLNLALLAAVGTIAATGIVSAQEIAPSIEVARSPGQMPTRDQPGGDGIAANGRCGGVSFGTGARRCGDLTGGPADGIGSRN